MSRPRPTIDVIVEPASPLQTPPLDSPSSFLTASESPPPLSPPNHFIPFPTSSSSGPPISGSTLSNSANLLPSGSRRPLLNKKRLSLILPSVPPPSSLLPLPPSPLLLNLQQQPSGSRSLPPSPTFLPQSLANFIGPEPANAEERDRTIGRLMMREKEEMREQLSGNRGMKRRKSIPGRLDLKIPGTTGVAGRSLVLDNGPMSARIGGPGAGGGGGGLMSLVGRERQEVMDRLPSAVPELEEDGTSSAASPVKADDDDEPFPYAFGPREILPGIYLGSETNARDPVLLAQYQFGAVLNVAKEVGCPWFGQEFEEVEDSFEELTQRDYTSTSPSASRRMSKHPASDATSPPTLSSSRLLFVRPTASTPNLQSAFSAASRSSPPPPVPPLPQRRMSLAPTAQNLPPISNSTSSNSEPIAFPAHKSLSRPALSYLWLKWGHDESDLVEAGKLDTAFAFLDEARDNGKNVLVHCQCGVSRSATVVIAYAMREAARALERGDKGGPLENVMGMHDTYSFVKEKSGWVGPNLGLVFQLVAYERILRGDLSPTSDMDIDGNTSDQEPPYQTFSSEDSESVSTSSIETPPPPPEKDDTDILSPLLSSKLVVSTHSSPLKIVSPTSVPSPITIINGDESHNSKGVFLISIPPKSPMKDELSPFPLNVTLPPPTPFNYTEISSPLPFHLLDDPTPSRRKRSTHSRTSSLSGSGPAGGRFAFPSPPKATLVTSTPTATAFSLAERPSAAQVSLWRGGEPSAASGSGGRFGAQQSLVERRASHRRVFSVPSI